MAETQRPVRLLIVDDEADFRAAVATALERAGFVVRQAESGERALRMLDEAEPDVVLLDLRMGGMDGIATLERIKQKLPDLPVIILTGHGRFQDALAGVHLRVIDFVQKPVEMEDLAARIHRLLAGPGAAPRREKSLLELLTPVDRYRTFYADQSVAEVIRALYETLFRPVSAEQVERRGRRAVLVYERPGRFLGLVRVEDIVRLMLPAYLRGSPYSSYFTGMFLAQTKLIGNIPLGEMVCSSCSVDAAAPLMEAVATIVAERLTNLPVTRDGVLLGVLRDEDLFKEIADSVLGR